MRVEGIDGRKVFMEAELDSGGDESKKMQNGVVSMVLTATLTEL